MALSAPTAKARLAESVIAEQSEMMRHSALTWFPSSFPASVGMHVSGQGWGFGLPYSQNTADSLTHDVD